MAKLNQGYVANKRWSLDRHDVSLEVLEDMGVSLLDDDSSSDCQQRESELEPPAVTEKRKEPPISPLPQEDWPDNFLLTKRKRVEGPPGADGFSRLSDEIILCVFRWLPKATIARCAQVSKRWKRLAYDEALWRRLDLSGVSLKPTVLGTVLMRGTQVGCKTNLKASRKTINFRLERRYCGLLRRRCATRSTTRTRQR